MLQDLFRHTETVLDSLYDGIVVVNREGLIVYVNQAHCRITGFRYEEVMGKPVKEVVPATSIEKVRETGQPLIGVRTQIGQGSVVSNIVPIKEGDQVSGVISIFRDITEVINLTKELKRAEAARDHYHDRLKLLGGTDQEVIIGSNPRIQRAFNIALKAAKVSSTVLVRGESGTGKEIIAQYIHENSERKEKPFIAVNCAALPESLLESELFGYAPGAFTGAKAKGKAGLFELADHGTLFLDEIGDIPFSLQAKLLRVLQTKEFQRVGGTERIKVDVHILAATNRDLEAMIGLGEFREDLYYRLNVISIDLPPLRERREDLHLFIEHFIEKLNKKLKTSISGLERDALETLLNYDYPGNLRELENIMEQAMVMAEGERITLAYLPLRMRSAAKVQIPPTESWIQLPTFAEMERELLHKGLLLVSSKSELADRLKISRATLYRKLKEYGLWNEK